MSKLKYLLVSLDIYRVFKKVFFLTIFFSLIFYVSESAAQITLKDDQQTVKLIQQALDCIYNLEFDQAQRKISLIGQRLKNHPIKSLMKAYYLRWNEMPIAPDTDAWKTYYKYLNLTEERAKKMESDDPTSPEAIFFNMAAHSLMAQKYAEFDYSWSALGEAKKAYTYMEKGFSLCEEYPDFYFSTGLYNYYRVHYPEDHPFYRSFLWIFSKGDKKLGLSQLKKGGYKAMFTAVESRFFYVYLNIRYEGNLKSAFLESEKLVKKYPNNPHFMIQHAELILLMNNYDLLKGSLEKIKATKYPEIMLFKKIFETALALNSQNLTKANQYLNEVEQGSKELTKRNLHLESWTNYFRGQQFKEEGKLFDAERRESQAIKLQRYAYIKKWMLKNGHGI